jgi:hypothetical protein
VTQHHFPPPWSVEDIGSAFVVKDRTGEKLGYFYWGGVRQAIIGQAAHEGRGPADRGEFSKLPELLRRSPLFIATPALKQAAAQISK